MRTTHFPETHPKGFVFCKESNEQEHWQGEQGEDHLALCPCS